MRKTNHISKSSSVSQRIIEVSCRVDFRPVDATTFCERTGRLELMSATGCIIRCQRPESWEALELRVYLPGGDWPLRVDHAQVTWGHWDEFTVEFLSMPATDQQRLQDYLAAALALAKAA